MTKSSISVGNKGGCLVVRAAESLDVIREGITTEGIQLFIATWRCCKEREEAEALFDREMCNLFPAAPHSVDGPQGLRQSIEHANMFWLVTGADRLMPKTLRYINTSNSILRIRLQYNSLSPNPNSYFTLSFSNILAFKLPSSSYSFRNIAGQESIIFRETQLCTKVTM
jgi:hypothetical protein